MIRLFCTMRHWIPLYHFRFESTTLLSSKQNKLNLNKNWMTLVLHMVFFLSSSQFESIQWACKWYIYNHFCLHSLRFYTGYWLQIYSLFIIRSTYRIERSCIWKSSYICKFNHIQLFAGHITLVVIFARATKKFIFKNTLNN